MTGHANPTAFQMRPAINDCWNKIGVRGDGSCPKLEQYIHCRNCPVFSAAAVELLDGDLPADHLADWTRHFAEEKQVEELDTQSVVIFRIGEEWLALPTGVFEEVAELRAIHSLPHRRNSLLLGLASVRGELLVCVSIGQVLGLGAAAAAVGSKREKSRTVHRRLLVIRREGSRVVFPVDEVHGIHHFHPRELKEVPATVAKAAATYTKTMLPWQKKSVGLLDDQLLFYTLNRSLTSATAT
jgi:chemotaxis-related protein WspD